MIENLDLSFGICYNKLSEHWASIPGNKLIITDYSTHSIDAGILMKLNLKIATKVDFDASLGYKKFNVENIEVDNVNNESYPLGDNDIFGAGLS